MSYIISQSEKDPNFRKITDKNQLEKITWTIMEKPATSQRKYDARYYSLTHDTFEYENGY